MWKRIGFWWRITKTADHCNLCYLPVIRWLFQVAARISGFSPESISNIINAKACSDRSRLLYGQLKNLLSDIDRNTQLQAKLKLIMQRHCISIAFNGRF